MSLFAAAWGVGFVLLSPAVTTDANVARPPELADVAVALKAEWQASVGVEVLVASEHKAALETTGRLAYDDDRTQHVRSAISGRVTAVKVRLGDSVRAGTPLLTLVSAEAAQLRAELHKDDVDIQVFGRARARAKSLLKEGAISPREASETEAQYNKAIAERARDLAHVATLGLNLRDQDAQAQLVAHLEGVVTARDVVAGEELRADSGKDLLTISDLNAVWLWADVHERDLGGIVPGAAVQAYVTAWPDRTFVGKLDYIGDVVDMATHTVKVRCRLANPDRLLKPHMFATVSIALADIAQLTLPTTALVPKGSNTFVVVVDTQERARLRQVEIGAVRGGRVPLRKGLLVGERIVTRGALLVAQAIDQAH